MAQGASEHPARQLQPSAGHQSEAEGVTMHQTSEGSVPYVGAAERKGRLVESGHRGQENGSAEQQAADVSAPAGAAGGDNAVAQNGSSAGAEGAQEVRLLPLLLV